MFLLAFLSVCHPLPADPPANPVPEVAPFARFVPDSAKLFVSVRHLGAVDDALRQTHAWRLLPLLTGTTGAAVETFDLRAALTSFLGPKCTIDIDELIGSEVGLVAPSWSRLDSAVWLARVADPMTFDRWFPEDQRSGGGRRVPTRLFRTRDGMRISSRHGVVAMSRRGGSTSLLREILRLMDGDSAEALERSSEFGDLMSHLPDDYLAIAYWARDDDAPDEITSSPWWPALDRAVLALFDREGRIDVAIRASLAAPHVKAKLTTPAIERLLRLPRTTLYASATTIDFGQAYAAATSTRPSGTLGRYIALLASIQSLPPMPVNSPPLYGPHVIFAWGQDLREDGLSPQIVVMMECSNARLAGEHARLFANKIIKLLGVIDPRGGGRGMAIERGRHLGVAINHIPLKAFAAESKLPFMKLLGEMDPAWAYWNGWFLVALTRDHLERVLDAQLGLSPALTSVRDVQSLRGRSRAYSVLSIVQPRLATDILDGWLRAYETGSPSLLDPSWWPSRSRPVMAEKLRLGIGMKIVQEPGVVVVARIYPGTPAEGLLQVGDRIVGIDGNLLSLTSPNADLRKRWSGGAPENGAVVRVRRGETITDVLLARRQDPRVSNVFIKPGDAVRELASLGRTVQFATFAVKASDEKHYSARLSLRFTTEKVTNSSLQP